MKIKKITQKVVNYTAFIGIACAFININPASASEIRFVCESSNGESTTFTSFRGTEKPFLIWNSGHFANSGYTDLVRCKQVTERLNLIFANGKNPHLTYGEMNNLPVICTSKVEGGSCSTLVYTLKSHQNPEDVLQSILAFDSNDVDAGDALQETNCPLYLSFDRQGNIKSSRACEPKVRMVQNLWNSVINLFN